MSDNLIDINGNLSVGRGQLGLCLFDSPNANIDLNSTYNTFYNKYILNPTININCILPTIGTGLNQVNVGYEIYICNISNSRINITTISQILRQNSIIHLIARSVGNWVVLQKYNSTNAINTKTGVPIVLGTDIAGDLYINTSAGTIYIFDGATWNLLTAASINVDPLSIQGTGIIADPYSTLSNINTQLSGESNIKDRALMLDTAGSIVSNKSISYQATVGTNVNSYQYNNIGVIDSTGSPDKLYYNPESDITIETVTIGAGTILIGPTLSGTTYSITEPLGQSLLVCKDNFGNVIWLIRTTGRTRTLDFYFDNSTGITWCVVSHYEISNVYDYSDLFTPVFTIPHSGSPYTETASLLAFDSNGYYVGSTVTPYIIDEAGLAGCEIRGVVGDSNGSLYIGGFINQGNTYRFNRYNNPLGTLYNISPSGVAGTQPSGTPFLAKFNITTRLFEWTTYCNNASTYHPGGNFGASNMTRLFIPNTHSPGFDVSAEYLIVCGVYAGNIRKTGGNFLNFGNVTYQNGTTINTTIHLPCVYTTTAERFTRITAAVDTTTGVPVWLNASLLQTNDSIYPPWLECVNMDEQNYLTYAMPYGTSINQLYLMKQQWINVSITNASNIITSAGLFKPGMHGMMIYGYGIPAGTRFNYTNINSGTLTNNATFTYGSGTSINPARVLISNQLNVLSMTSTIGLAAVTSPEGLFTATMNGQFVIGPNVADNTTFTFVNANNGTLSIVATATGTANHFIIDTINYYNTVNTGTFALLGAKMDVNGNFVWAKNLCTSTNLPSVGSRLAIDRFNNLFLTCSALGTFTFSNGDVIPTNRALIAKFTPSGDIIYTKNYSNGTAGNMAQISGSLFMVEFYVNGSLNLDGTTFSTANSLIRTFMIENDDRKFGIALENLGLVNTKYATNGVITTSAALNVGKVYYISQSDGTITDNNIYGLNPIGIAINTNQLMLL